MTLCINPHCDKPQNPDNAQFCQNCGSALLLKQRYRATKVLGEGGFGKTYAASDLGTPNKVIKVLINNSPKAVELFQREAEVLSQLNNPGIPRVEPNSYIVFHPTNSQQPVHCLVMEKVEGMNLRDYLKQLRQPIDSETAERWLKELVLILQEVHEKGILHRDVKPQNIIFKPDGRLALIDFGAVREGTGTEVATGASSGGGTEVASHMAGGTSVVSRGYTAPEQMNGEALKQSDFYSLGRTFIFLLTGKEPSEISYDAYNDVLQWRQHAPNVEPKLAELLDQMQSTQVKQRPAKAQIILGNLEGRKASSHSSHEPCATAEAELVAHLERGMELGSQGKFDEALYVFNEAIKLDSSCAQAYVLTGVILKRQGKQNEAISALRKGIQIDPDDAIAHNSLGDILLDQGNYDEAFSAYCKAIQINPSNASYHNDLGKLLFASGNADEALTEFQKAVQIDPNEAGYHINFGMALQELGNSDEAIVAFHKAIQIDPNEADYQNYLGDALLAQENLDEAIVAYRKAIKIDPNEAVYYANLGIALNGRGESDEAISALQKAIQVNPGYIDVYGMLGLFLCNQGRLDEGVVTLRKGIQIDPNNADIKDALQSALIIQGQQKKKFLGLF